MACDNRRRWRPGAARAQITFDPAPRPAVVPPPSRPDPGPRRPGGSPCTRRSVAAAASRSSARWRSAPASRRRSSWCSTSARAVSASSRTRWAARSPASSRASRRRRRRRPRPDRRRGARASSRPPSRTRTRPGRPRASRSRRASPANPDYLVRVYLALKDQAPTPIDETPLAPTADDHPGHAHDGHQRLHRHARRVRAASPSRRRSSGGSSTTKPAIKLASPKDGAMINRKAVTLEGGPRAARRSTPGTRRPASRSAGPPQPTARSR